MIPVSYVKTSESDEVALVTVNRQTPFASDILRQDYGIIRGLQMNHTCSTGRPNYCIGSDCMALA